MLSVLFSGTVVRAPEQRLDRRQRPIATAGMEIVDAEGRTLLVSLIAFRTYASTAVMRLKEGDEASIVGHASLNRWTDPDGSKKTGLNVTVSRVMTIDEAGVHFTPQERREWRENAVQEAARG